MSMEESEKIENPDVEYDNMPSSHDNYSSMAQPGRFRVRYNAVWQQVSSRDRKHIAVIILVAMFVLLLLNIIDVIKILKEV